MVTTKRITIVLRERPKDKFEEFVVATEIRDEIMPEVEHFGWKVYDDVPDGLDVGARDQLEAYRRDAGENSCYMVVYG